MKGMKTLGKLPIQGTFYEIVIADRLQEQNECMAHGGSIYFRKDRSIESMVDDLLGFASREYRAQISGRNPRYKDWPDGLWIGERRVRVQIVQSGTEPDEWLLDLDENILLILGDKSPFTVLRRAASASSTTFGEWERLTIKRAFRKEKPRFQPDVPQVFEDGKPTSRRKTNRKPRVKPGELLPRAERDQMLAQGDAILKAMFEPQQPPAIPEEPKREAA